MFLKILQISQENTGVGVSVVGITLQIYKNKFFEDHLPTIAFYIFWAVLHLKPSNIW